MPIDPALLLLKSNPAVKSQFVRALARTSRPSLQSIHQCRDKYDNEPSSHSNKHSTIDDDSSRGTKATQPDRLKDGAMVPADIEETANKHG